MPRVRRGWPSGWWQWRPLPFARCQGLVGDISRIGRGGGIAIIFQGLVGVMAAPLFSQKKVGLVVHQVLVGVQVIGDRHRCNCFTVFHP